jgi:predicted Zn-dependent peptidase
METFKDYNVTRVAGKLDNGIPVILFNRPNTPIAIQAVLKSGSKYDSENNPGTAHFMEHMIVNGSKEFPSKDLLAEHIESVGGSMGAMTGQELMWVNTEISDEADLDRAIDVFKASLCNPLFDEKVFENEKNVVIKEIQRSHSNPATFAAMNALELFFKGSAYGHPVLGNEDGIKSLVYQNSLFDRKKLFDKSRIVFVASGDVSFEKLIIKLNQLIFSSGEVLNPSNDNFTFPDEKQRTVYFDAPQTHIHFGVPAPVSYTPEATYMSILGEILAGGRAHV